MAHSAPKSSDKPSKRSAVYLLNLNLTLFSTDTTPLRVEDSIILNLQDIWLWEALVTIRMSTQSSHVLETHLPKLLKKLEQSWNAKEYMEFVN